MGRHPFNQAAKVFPIDPLRFGIRRELQLHVLPWQRVDLNLVQRLQRESTGETSSSMA
jgi:hypothetical protein